MVLVAHPNAAQTAQGMVFAQTRAAESAQNARTEGHALPAQIPARQQII
jgi:hypothetical protein